MMNVKIVQQGMCILNFLLTCNVIAQYSDDGHYISFSDGRDSGKRPRDFEEIEKDDVS